MAPQERPCPTRSFRTNCFTLFCDSGWHFDLAFWFGVLYGFSVTFQRVFGMSCFHLCMCLTVRRVWTWGGIRLDTAARAWNKLFWCTACGTSDLWWHLDLAFRFCVACCFDVITPRVFRITFCGGRQTVHVASGACCFDLVPACGILIWHFGLGWCVVSA